jgi:hypothetical protein
VLSAHGQGEATGGRAKSSNRDPPVVPVGSSSVVRKLGRVVSVVAGVLALVGPASAAVAHPALPVTPTSPVDLTYTATDNVEFLGRFPEHFGTAGGRMVGDRFYLTDPRGVFVYDTSVPEEPVLLGSLALPQSGTAAALAQEDPDTDGRILLVDAIDPEAGSASAGLKVVDVSDPTAMQVIGSAPVADHTWTCVSTATNGCAYAYGRTGYIVDLTDPTAPRVLDTSWREHVGLGEGFSNSPYTHDLTEFRTGRVMSAGAHNVLMDTTDPAAPKLLNDLVVDYHTFGYHSVEWPNAGRDPFLVAGTEIAPEGPTNLAGSDCQGEGSWINTYRATEVAKADRIAERSGNVRQVQRAEFERVDSYHVADRGIFLDGNAPAHTLYCAHWMELAPSFDGGGRMVVAYYDWGTRFVDVHPDGTMDELGWFLPGEGYAGSAQWITDEVVYVMDYRRGLEVLRLTGEPATGTVVGGIDLVMAGSTTQAGGAWHRLAEQPHWALLLAGAALALVGHRRRRATGTTTSPTTSTEGAHL